MKRVFAALILLLSGLASFPAFAQSGPSDLSRTAGVYVASRYDGWGDKVVSGNTTTGSATITVQRAGALRDGRAIPGYNINAPITIDQGASQETVTPTAASATVCTGGGGNSSQNQCWNITASFSFTHGAGTIVTTGTNGLQEAINDAGASGGSSGGVVVVDKSWQGTTAILAAGAAVNGVEISDNRGLLPAYWTIQPTTLTAVSTPATRVAAAACTTAATAVCDSTAVGTWSNSAYHVCVTYIDALGGETPCSADASYTSAGSLAIQFNSPAASTGAVGWRAYAGTSYAAAYQLPITSANCVLSTLENVMPSCAMGAVGLFATPTTTTQLRPGYTVATYDPVTQSHTTMGYLPSSKLPSACSPQSNFGPYAATAGGTTTQVQVLGTVNLVPGCLNYIGKTIRITGKISAVTGSGETPKILVELGPTFTTGTPTAICTMASTVTTGTGVTDSDVFSCTMTVNATGTSGTVQPDGFALVQSNAAGATASDVMTDTGTAAITDNIAAVTQTLYVLYVGTSATNTSAQLLDLHIEDL